MSIGLVWFRRDLRLHDHAALSASVRENDKTHLVFVFDENILAPLRQKSRQDDRVHFICQSLLEMQEQLQKHGCSIILRRGCPREIIPNLVEKLNVDTLYFNRDYSPYPLERDSVVEKSLKSVNRSVKSFRDHVIFEPQEVLKNDGTPFRVFTPYSRAWLSSFHAGLSPTKAHECPLSKIANKDKSDFQSIEDVLNLADFEASPPLLPGGTSNGRQRLSDFQAAMKEYNHRRDLLFDEEGTSRISPYIRHGCVSIRELVLSALEHNTQGAEKWLSELIWREFNHMIVGNFPHVKTQPFNAKFNSFHYPGLEEHHQLWKAGKTGFPVIDAGMRCLNETGWMHNRMRMIVASFYCKILLLDWRRGAKYFAWKLLDYEFASNNGGWQWSAGTGCDASPYFRIFNPYLQSKKFDPEGTFIKKWCPELSHLSSKQIHEPPPVDNYPSPIVNYSLKRKEALELYKQIK